MQRLREVQRERSVRACARMRGEYRMRVIATPVILMLVGSLSFFGDQRRAHADETKCQSVAVEHPCVTFFQWLSGKRGGSADRPEQPRQTPAPDNIQTALPQRPESPTAAPHGLPPSAQSSKFSLKTRPVGFQKHGGQVLSLVGPVPRPMPQTANTSQKTEPTHVVPSGPSRRTTPAARPPIDPATLSPAAARGIRQDEPGEPGKREPAMGSLPPAANPDNAPAAPSAQSESATKATESPATAETPMAVANAPASVALAAPTEPQPAASLTPEILASLLDSGRRLTSFDFPIEIGQPIPDDVNLVVIPPEVVAQRPELGGRFYIVVGQKAVVADPQTRRIVQILGPAT
jgi:hypothetical protein